MADPAIELLSLMAKALQPILDEVVFVGGCVTGLLVTEAVGEPRPTDDVDVIVATSDYPDYVRFSERLRQLGFAEDPTSKVICRWKINGLKLDVMPHDTKALGFSNTWYKAAIGKAQGQQLPNRLTIRVITAPYFVATKLEAFQSRGKGDFVASPDLEDLINVLDGRPNVVAEITAEAELHEIISAEFSKLIETPAFIDALPGYLPGDEASQGRLPGLLEKIKKLAALQRKT